MSHEATPATGRPNWMNRLPKIRLCGKLRRVNQPQEKADEQAAQMEVTTDELRELERARAAKIPRQLDAEKKRQRRKILAEAVRSVLEDPAFSPIDNAVLTQELPAIVSNELYARVRLLVLAHLEKELQALRAEKRAFRVELAEAVKVLDKIETPK
ncbi:hypothetical protein DFQ27_007941 [Actinomortierella ambigua]|uniref:Uncharacterized protein n=1 Tax=Actinomortierella ambigua TaxID=1343610 RepID=A0A9P6TZ00_9FUNG|nr:hypothetical protein DFQ27_007941 [Actinomortierella ambigua]